MERRRDSGPNVSFNRCSFENINPEDSRALQMLTADDVLTMRFYSFQAAESFYDKYALVVGFIIRKDAIVRNKQGEVVMRRWACNRQRTYLEDGNSHWDPRPETRITCPAAFGISFDRVSHRWLVKEFVAEHTHDLAPTCRLPLPLPVMPPETGNDVEKVLAYLRAKNDADPGLLYEIKLDEGRLASIFLADSTSQLDCACFGDVMAVYRTNLNDLHFVVLAGLNHHHQTIVFGCAVLHDDTVESYSWLFQNFLQVMQGCMPITVVTDGHKALSEAIKLVLPRSRHRLCTWHLEKFARSKVNVPSFIPDFKAFMLEALSPDDFELKWKAMVDKYKLSENTWIQKMYEKRHEWAETYFRGHFWAGLRSTKVCESIGRHLSWFPQLKPHQLIDQYNTAVDHIRWNEVVDEYDSKKVKVAVSTTIAKIEKHAADVFTRESYQRFLSEMRSETLLFVLRKEDGSSCHKYKLGKYEDPNLTYEVMFKPSGPSIKCSCLKFETLGIPCRHAVHVMKYEGLGEIPWNLIHPRWTKEAKSTPQFWRHYVPAVPADVVERMVRFGTLMSACSLLMYLALQSDQAFDLATSGLDELLKKLNEEDDKERGINENKRRNTQGDGHSGNMEQISIDNSRQSGRFDQGRGLVTKPQVDH